MFKYYEIEDAPEGSKKTLEDIKKSISVAQEDIKEYYEDNKKQFFVFIQCWYQVLNKCVCL